MKEVSRNRTRVIITAVAVCSAISMHAAELLWVGNTDANWATAANWSPAQTPAAGDVLVFDSVGSAGAALNNDLGSVALDSLIVLSNGLSTWSWSGNAIEYTNTIVCSNLNALTINNDIILGSERPEIYVHTEGADFGSVTLNGVISDAGNGRAFRVKGDGVVTLVESNTFSGGLQLWGGYVRMDSGPENLGLNTNILVGGNSVSEFVDYTGDNSINAPTNRLNKIVFTVETNSTLQVRGLGAEYIDAKFTGEGSVRFGTANNVDIGAEGGNLWFPNTDSDFTGDYLHGFGTLRFNSIADPGQPSSLGAGEKIVLRNSLSAASLRYYGTNASSTTRPLVWDNKTGNFAVYNDDQGGPLASVKFLSPAPLRVPEDAAGNAEFRLRGANAGRNEIAQSFNDAYDTNGVFLGNTTVAKGINATDPGTWILSGVNTNTGLYKIFLGTLEFARPVSLPSVAQVSFTSKSAATDEACIGLLVGGSGFTSAGVDSVISGLTVQANSSSSLGIDTFNGDFTYGTAITKGMGVHKLGPNNLTLTGANTYNGSTRVKEGTLLVNGSTAAAVAGRQLSGNSNAANASMIVYYDPALGGATLGGSGTVGGVTWIRRGARIQGGNASFTGTLTLGGLVMGDDGVDDWSRLRFNIAAGGKIATTSFSVTGTNHVVQILDAVLTVGTNTLITYTGGSIVGSNGFGGLRLDTLPAGVTANLLNTGSAVQLAVTAVPAVGPTQPAQILGVTQSGNTIVVNGTNLNGGSSFQYVVLSSTNVTAPLASWTPLATNAFNVDGTFVFTNAIDPAQPVEFFNTKAQ